MTNKRIEERLNQDEGAWLKMIGEIGDMARMILRSQDETKKLTEQVVRLTDRLAQLEERLIPILTKESKPDETNKAN